MKSFILMGMIHPNAPTLIKNLYTQFPDNDKVGYYNDNPYFSTHVNNLTTIIGSTTDTFSIADIIRTYIGN